MGPFLIVPKKTENSRSEEDAEFGCQKPERVSGKIRPAGLPKMNSEVGHLLRSWQLSDGHLLIFYFQHIHDVLK